MSQHHLSDDRSPELVSSSIPATSDAALSYLAGEGQARAWLVRLGQGIARPGELAQLLGVHNVPRMAGFCACVEKCLNAHMRGGSQ
jgi:hypothetical protein